MNKNLYAALSKAQAQIKGAAKDAANPFFKSKYADLASVWEACREAITSNGLAVIQSPEMLDGIVGITTKLVHETGEVEESFLPLPLKAGAGAQDYGSAITYMRRYALAAMVGVAPEDDDGNQAQSAAPPKVKKETGVSPHIGDKDESVRTKQIIKAINESPDLNELQLYWLGIEEEVKTINEDYRDSIVRAKDARKDHFKELGE